MTSKPSTSWSRLFTSDRERIHICAQVAADPTETDEMLTLVGRQLGKLMWADAISEFDMRDLTEIAGEIVLTWTPDQLQAE